MTNIPAEHARLLRLATNAALGTAILLAICKAVAWWLSGSVSLLGGLTDSLLDGVASLLNLLAVRYSLRPADDNHRYGHGKAEALAGLGQAAFICISALIVGTQAIDRLFHPEPLGSPTAGIVVMLLSLAVTVALLAYQRHVVRITGSTAVRADSLHYHSDLLLNGSILLALLLASVGLNRVDAFFGIGIAFYILWNAIGIAREASSILMDTELPTEIGQHMQQLINAVPDVLGCHDLRTRASGMNWFVQLHIDLPDEMPLRRVHAVCEAITQAIRQEYPNTEVLVHADPLHLRSRWQSAGAKQ
ncbi:cation diffusion facilitator family transporter [Azomonas macrocytogenes]|uniref:Cation-efflux pump FieF n=1 Tax=Azomonas macrocytogenes TaxID=69962 RepID=A0A839T313_AZOMA|nr:cation diffusion facilitator family transporter [Azomonas macrocytogenes]MBB3102754.1 cation diffusion facilitator family transporter [Azomonas macrocytogenes]